MFSSLDKNIIRKLQSELPLVPEPYKVIADELQISENELLKKIKEFLDKGIIRRFGATLNHRNVGFKENAMVVWKVPVSQITEIARIIIEYPEVSHCYQRPTYPNWPYNLFIMVHGRTKESCEEIVKEMSKAIKINEYNILYSTSELKKCSMKYFLEK